MKVPYNAADILGDLSNVIIGGIFVLPLDVDRLE